jgi:probable F420-dependent oxidoreductase
MRLGVHLPQFRVPIGASDIERVARAAEAAGVDDLWVSDHVALAPGSSRPPADFHDALTVLTWAAAATTRCRLGTSVLVAPYRPAATLAKAIATLDVLSGGRVTVGIASGWLEEEFASVGVPYASRGRTTDAVIDACRALWSGATYRGAVVAPPPLQGRDLPIWVGGNSDAGIRRAASRGDGWHTTVADPEHLAERLLELDRALARAGRTRTGFAVSVRLRADAAGIARHVDAWRALGVDHVLVDHPDVIPADLVHELDRLRRVTRAPVRLPGAPGSQ